VWDIQDDETDAANSQLSHLAARPPSETGKRERERERRKKEAAETQRQKERKRRKNETEVE
jgi:hypothetical protein